MPTYDYLTLGPEQLTGDAYIIGDVHGSIEAFEDALSRLSPNDVLIVAGDLIDRGENTNYVPSSSQVLDRIIANNLPGEHGPKVYVIKGNHEVDFLSVLSLMKQLAVERNVDPDAPASEQLIAQLKRFIKNGGRWIFKSEMSGDPTISWFRHYATTGHSDSGTQSEAILRSMLNDGNPLDLLIDKFSDYESLISALPYIIKIDSPDKPALVAHADLPFNDDVLRRKMDAEEGLSQIEKAYITTARVQQFNSHRTATSIPVYCGHNIIDMPNSVAHPAVPVRKDTNHINLDVGAYFTQGLLLFNHTKGTAEIAGPVNTDILDSMILYHAKKTLERHVASVRALIAPTASTAAGAPASFFSANPQAASIKKSRKRPADDITPSI